MLSYFRVGEWLGARHLSTTMPCGFDSRLVHHGLKLTMIAICDTMA